MDNFFSQHLIAEFGNVLYGLEFEYDPSFMMEWFSLSSLVVNK